MEVSKISLKLWPDLTPMSTPRVQHEKEVRLIRYRSLPKGNNTIYHEWKWKKKKDWKVFLSHRLCSKWQILQISNDNLTTAWLLPDNCLTTAWRLPDDCVMTAWWLLDDRLTTFWRLSDNYLTTTWQVPDKCLTSSWTSLNPNGVPYFA